MTTTEASRARWKVFGSILTTYGYALVGGAVIQPILTTGKVTALLGAALGLGIVLHVWAWYVAPKGEKP